MENVILFFVFLGLTIVAFGYSVKFFVWCLTKGTKAIASTIDTVEADHKKRHHRARQAQPMATKHVSQSEQTEQGFKPDVKFPEAIDWSVYDEPTYLRRGIIIV